MRIPHARDLSDLEHVRIRLKSAVGIVSQNALSKEFAELYAFLVEAVDVPYEALEHNLVLEVSKERAERLGIEVLACDDAGRTAAGECLVGVLVSLAASKCHDLSRDVSAELLLAGAALNDNIHADLAVVKSYELHGNNVGSLSSLLLPSRVPLILDQPASS